MLLNFRNICCQLLLISLFPEFHFSHYLISNSYPWLKLVQSGLKHLILLFLFFFHYKDSLIRNISLDLNRLYGV